jgi:hypothetical protein
MPRRGSRTSRWTRTARLRSSAPSMSDPGLLSYVVLVDRFPYPMLSCTQCRVQKVQSRHQGVEECQALRIRRVPGRSAMTLMWALHRLDYGLKVAIGLCLYAA